MTLVYKEASWKHPLVANYSTTKKMLLLKKYKRNSNEATTLPLDCVLQHPEVKLHHDLINNWKTYQTVVWSSVVGKNAFTGQNTIIGENTIIEQSDIGDNCIIGRNCQIKGSHIGNNTIIGDNTIISEQSYIGNNCRIGSNSNIKGSHTGNNTVVGDFTVSEQSDIGNNCRMGSNCNIKEIHIGNNTLVGDSTVSEQSDMGNNCIIGKNCNIRGCHMKNNVIVKDNLTLRNCSFDDNSVVDHNCNDSRVTSQSTLKWAVLDEADKATNDKTLLKSASDGTEWKNESSGDDDELITFEKVWRDSESCYSSDSSVDSSMPGSPVPNDTDIFLQEIIVSLTRGYGEKLKCDNLILEINSSRYANNIEIHEVNFFVVRAMLSMPILMNSKSVLGTVEDILKYLRPVLDNYIKTKPSIMDCLKAVEESCLENVWLNGKSCQVIHLFYEMDVVDEDSLLEWRNDMQEDKSPLCKEASLMKFFEWLQQASEESKESY